MRAGFGLPPGVHDRAALAADVIVIPDPGFGIDRLADRAEQAQALERMPRWQLRAPAHERANRGRRGVENVHAVLIDDGPEAVAIGEIGRALVHERSAAVGQRPVDDVGMPGDPADVGGAPVDVVLLDVEDVVMRGRRADQVAAGGVHDALGFAGGAAGVEDEEHVLGVHGLGGAFIGSAGDEFVPPEVAARFHVRLGGVADAPHDDRLFRSWAFRAAPRPRRP